jgi:D-glycerate 3-kinase
MCLIRETIGFGHVRHSRGVSFRTFAACYSCRVIELGQAMHRAQSALQLRMQQLGLRLDERYLEQCVGRLAQLILARAAAVGGCPIIGLSGAQGTGKSTLALLLSDLLSHGFGKRVALVSLDDYYLSRAERQTLAAEVHPLLSTRGVPGTHAHSELHAALRKLRVLASGQSCTLLCFDKASDDRAPKPRTCSGPCDLILFEGWCVGARPESAAELVQPINALEQLEDSDGVFRRFVNTQLEGPYSAMWRELDLLVFAAAPDFSAVHAFRRQQEEALRRAAPAASGVMDDAALERFVQHFERITRSMLRSTPSYADAVIELDVARDWMLNIKSV